MVKCNKCAITAECRKHGKIKVEVEGEVIEVCPLLYLLDVVASLLKAEIEKNKIEEAVKK